MAATRQPVGVSAPVLRGDAAPAMYRAAQAVSHPGGPTLFADLVGELAALLQAAAVFVATFGDDTRRTMRTLAAQLDGRPLRDFDYALEGSPCAQVVGRSFRHLPSGAATEFGPDTTFGAKGMDAYAAFPLCDSVGAPLGLLVAMDRSPAGPLADTGFTEALLKIFAGRIVAELERERVDASLRTAALAVSSARGESVFAELARYLATALHVDLAFIARHEPGADPDMHMLAVACDGRVDRGARYALATSPCAGVLGQGFRAWPERLRELFPDDGDAQALGLEGYAGHPVNDSRGRALGTIGVASRQPLAHLERIESMLQIFAVRAAAELEQLQASEALRRSEASYRAIFESAEDAIFVHDWDSGALLDANPKACETYGYTRDELLRLSVAELSSGVPPYTADEAWRWMQRARLGRCPPIEWHRRNKDGSLHWDEVRLKPVQIDGRPHILASTREITAYKAALAELRTREEQYRAVFEGSADALAVWNAGLRIVDVNHAFTRLFGLTREEAIGRRFSRRLGTQSVARRVRLLRAALAGQEGTMEDEALRKDGSRFAIELRYLPIGYAGEPHVLVVGRDISARRAADQALRDSEQQYRGIFNASADALVLRDAEFRIVDVNHTYERMSGYTRDEALGQARVLANPPETGAVVRKLHVRALAGEPISLQTQLVRRDGARYELELRGVPITHRGQPHVLYIGRDITEARRAEQALRDSEEQYRAIFNAATDGLLLRDAECRAVEVNPAYLALTGYSREEVIGSSRVLTQGDEENAHCRQTQARVLAGEVLRIEATETRKDGSTFVAEVRGMPVVYRGRPHVLYVTRDITLAREAQAHRAELERQLRQAQKMEAIGQLSGGIAHDFNNILTSVIGYLALAGERADTLADATLQRQLGSARHAAQRARELVAQLLAFARRRRGERRLLAPAPVVEQMLQLLRSTLPASVAIDAGPALSGDGGADLRVAADPVQLEQVLFNLCINARDAIAGPGVIRIRLGADGGGWRCASCRVAVDGGRWVAIEVGDSGRGIAPEVLERMFEPFFSTKEVGRGSGMGLAMVHGIVHDHGGHVEVQTHPGEGTRFRVLLPQVEADAGAERVGVAAAPGRAASPPQPLRGRVLLVEDEAMVGEFMAELLSGWGLDVQVQPDALVAAAWLEDHAHEIDLLITDQTMPGLTGLELTRRARAARPTLTVLLYTGHADAVSHADLQRHGVHALLHKPVDPDVLRARVQEALQVGAGPDPAAGLPGLAATGIGR